MFVVFFLFHLKMRIFCFLDSLWKALWEAENWMNNQQINIFRKTCNIQRFLILEIGNTTVCRWIFEWGILENDISFDWLNGGIQWTYHIQIIWRICRIFFFSIPFVCSLKCWVMFNFLRCRDFGFVSMIEWLAGLFFGRHSYRLNMLKIDSMEKKKIYC